MSFKLFAFIILLLPLNSYADITGKASVIDGDTIEIHGQRIRLTGIDAPESGQLCNKGGEDFRCGRESTDALYSAVGSKQVKCIGKKKDRYKRLLAECYVGEVNLNSYMVSSGWALAYRQYSKKFIKEEIIARENKLGIWEGNFIEPSQWRKNRR